MEIRSNTYPRLDRVLDRLHARLASRAKAAAEFSHHPAPALIGRYAYGRQLLAGNFLFAGHLIEAPGVSIWEAAERSPGAMVLAQDFSWLDDLAAVGDLRARQTAQTWLRLWIEVYGSGRRDGWASDLVGRRLIRFMAHASFLLRGSGQAFREAYFRSTSHQAIFLSRRWRAAPAGLPRFEALAGLIYACSTLKGLETRVAPGVAGLANECAAQIGADGAIASRNPEELLEILTMLNLVQSTLKDSGLQVPQAVLEATQAIVPVLRALRHADGSLARFHGGGKGKDGWLDDALSAGVRPIKPEAKLYMGYGRLAAGRTSILIDVDRPPGGPFAVQAHASTLAIEVSSGRRPLIVNCGSGGSFGPEWRRAGRATPSHSTASIEGLSSARIVRESGGEMLKEGPREVQSQIVSQRDGLRIEAAHDGYRAAYGLTHVRIVELSRDGRALTGEDILTTLENADEPLFEAALDRTEDGRLDWSVRFHLHPEVEPVLYRGGEALSLTLKSGEIWVLRQEGADEMRLEPSVYLENGRLRPRATKQVVLSGRAMSYATRIRWSLAKAQETPVAIRDVADDLADLEH